MNKDDAYRMVEEALRLCTVEESHHAAVLVSVNEKENTVRVYGLNIAEEDVATLLVEAAEQVAVQYIDNLEGRTLQ